MFLDHCAYTVHKTPLYGIRGPLVKNVNVVFLFERSNLAYRIKLFLVLTTESIYLSFSTGDAFTLRNKQFADWIY